MTYYEGYAGKWMSEDAWARIQGLTGRPLWIGYDNGGWDSAGDEYLIRFWEWPDAMVSVFYSPSRDEYQFYPNQDRGFTGAGDRYGLHPCGGWAVNATVIDEIATSLSSAVRQPAFNVARIPSWIKDGAANTNCTCCPPIGGHSLFQASHRKCYAESRFICEPAYIFSQASPKETGL